MTKTPIELLPLALVVLGASQGENQSRPRELAPRSSGSRPLAARAAEPVRRDIDLPWKPVPVPNVGTLDLCRVPVHRTVLEVSRKERRVLPVGWSGEDRRTGATVRIPGERRASDVRQTIEIRPPAGKDRHSTVFIEFPLQLPKQGPLQFRFSLAVARPAARSAQGDGDGVTFRVRMIPFSAPDGKFGDVIFEWFADAETWQDVVVDLAPFRGSAVRLQLESHPGPKGDATNDLSYWADPRVVAGAQ